MAKNVKRSKGQKEDGDEQQLCAKVEIWKEEVERKEQMKVIRLGWVKLGWVRLGNEGSNNIME